MSGRGKHFDKTYNYQYPDFFSQLPDNISLKLMEEWTNIHYTSYSWRFWILNNMWYVVEVPKLDNKIELQCYDKNGNEVYKWNDNTRYNIDEHSSIRVPPSLYQSKGGRTMSFPKLLDYYRTTIYGESVLNIIPKPDPPDPPDAQDPRRSATTIRL